MFRKAGVVRLYSINNPYLWPIIIDCNEQTICMGDAKLEYYTERSILQKIDELISQHEKGS